MGCWNETCGITQMPILEGDKVRMFLIVENEWNADVSHSYTTDLWRPFGLPLKGTYDEYGRIENIEEDVLSDLLLQGIKDIIVEVPNRMGDIFKREDLNWETVIEFLTDEGLKVTDPSHISFIDKKLKEVLSKVKEKFPNLPDNGWSSERSKMADEQKKIVEEDKHVVRMYHMMVHEDVYQALAKEYKAPKERFSSWTSGDFRSTLQKDVKKYIDEIRQALAEEAKLTVNERASAKFRRFLNRNDINNRFVSVINHLTGNYGSGLYLRKYLDFVEKIIVDGASDNDVRITTLTDQFIDFLCFNQCMILLRKMWAPQCGKGGQDQEFALHKFLGETISALSEKKIKESDELYGEHDSEEEEEENDEEDQ